MAYMPAIFSLIVAAAGWFYLFYSRAAVRLSHVESSSSNRLRVRLRRIGGIAMMLLAVSFYLGCAAIERRQSTAAAMLFFTVMVLLGAILILGFIDLKLTHRVRKQQQHGEE